MNDKKLHIYTLDGWEYMTLEEIQANMYYVINVIYNGSIEKLDIYVAEQAIGKYIQNYQGGVFKAMFVSYDVDTELEPLDWK